MTDWYFYYVSIYLLVPVKYVENVESYFWNSLKGITPLAGCSPSRRPMRSLSCITSSLQPSFRCSWCEMFRNVFLLTQFSRYFSSSLTPLDLPTLKENEIGEQFFDWIFKISIFCYNKYFITLLCANSVTQIKMREAQGCCKCCGEWKKIHILDLIIFKTVLWSWETLPIRGRL